MIPSTMGTEPMVFIHLEHAKDAKGDYPEDDVVVGGMASNFDFQQVEDSHICVVMVGLPARGKSLIAQKSEWKIPFRLCTPALGLPSVSCAHQLASLRPARGYALFSVLHSSLRAPHMLSYPPLLFLRGCCQICVSSFPSSSSRLTRNSLCY